MANAVNFDIYGFFNSIMPLNQTNWSSFFVPTIADGVIADVEDELEVYGNSSGMYVYVKAGECRVGGHRGVLSNSATLEIDNADNSLDRIDLIVARVTYGTPSKMQLCVKKGTPSASPSAPSASKTAGSVWEIPLANVSVGHGAVTINAADVEDRRFVYTVDGVMPLKKFSGTSLTVKNLHHYYNLTAIDSLTISLPSSFSGSWECVVNFYASASFSGVTFQRDGSSYTPWTDSDLTIKNTKYNMEIWWTGSKFFVIAHTDAGKPIESFTGSSVTLSPNRIYRNTTAAVSSLTITLPNSPVTDWRAGVDFQADGSFSGINFLLANGNTPTILTDGDLSLQSTHYHLDIFWTGTNYRVVAHPNSGVQTNQGVPILSFSGTSVTVEQNREHRNTTAANSMTITLPSSPRPNFISSVRFVSSDSFTGTTIKKGSTTISGTTSLKLKGDALTMKGKVYQLVFWWDGTYYWCASAAA